MSLTGRPSFICFESRPQVGVEQDEAHSQSHSSKSATA
jgi:hypothetical protein